MVAQVRSSDWEILAVALTAAFTDEALNFADSVEVEMSEIELVTRVVLLKTYSGDLSPDLCLVDNLSSILRLIEDPRSGAMVDTSAPKWNEQHTWGLLC